MWCQLKNHAAKQECHFKWREVGIHLGFLPGKLDNTELDLVYHKVHQLAGLEQC